MISFLFQLLFLMTKNVKILNINCLLINNSNNTFGMSFKTLIITKRNKCPFLIVAK